ncbi:MAG: mechanosensitive ion channel [Alphaproteobacteria bacterium]|nr:mechanosensitive ion channel [Alphaproteobacteria bacterium]
MNALCLLLLPALALDARAQDPAALPPAARPTDEAPAALPRADEGPAALPRTGEGPATLPGGEGEEASAEEAPGQEAAPEEAAGAEAAGAEAAGEDAAGEDAPEPPPWAPVPEGDRIIDGVPQLGPWPDHWAPERDGQAGLPLIDPLTFDTLDPGSPYLAGPELGPTPPPELLGPFAPLTVDPAEPPDAVAAEPGETLLVEATPAEPEPTAAPAPEPAATAAPVLGPRRSIAEDLLPPPPRSGGNRALLFALLALMAFLGGEVTERLQERVLRKGLLPRFLSMLTGIGRGLTIPLVFVAVLSLLPHSWGLAVPFALVALALAFGWTARDLLADVFAGIVLTIERRVQAGERIEVGDHKGVVQGLGLRTTRLTVDDGRMVSMPNRQLLRQDLRVDPDSYAPVQVPVHVHPHLSVGEVRQQLQELALLSPYIAPSRPPNVYRDADRPEVWIVEARLVHPRFANAFRGALVELADEVFTPGEV